MTKLPEVIELIPAGAAAAMLQPALGDVDAALWLVDLRRAHPAYARRVSKPPRFVRFKGRTHYPLSEIERIVRELGGPKPVPTVKVRARPSAPPAPADDIETLPVGHA